VELYLLSPVYLQGIPRNCFNFTFTKLNCFEQQAGQFTDSSITTSSKN